MTWMLRYVKSPVLLAFVDALHHGFHSLRSVSSRLRLEFTDLQDFDFTLLKQAQPFETRFEIGTAGRDGSVEGFGLLKGPGMYNCITHDRIHGTNGIYTYIHHTINHM